MGRPYHTIPHPLWMKFLKGVFFSIIPLLYLWHISCIFIYERLISRNDIFVSRAPTNNLFLAAAQRKKIIMKENDISDRILDCCFKVHKNLGPGLFESVFEEILVFEMSDIHLNFERQKAISLKYGVIKLDASFRAEFIVEKKVIVELKSVEKILPVHKKQLLTYLKISHCKLGLLVNFNTELLKDGIHRVVNNL